VSRPRGIPAGYAVRLAGPHDLTALGECRARWTQEQRGPLPPDPTYAARLAEWADGLGSRLRSWLAVLDDPSETPVGMVNTVRFDRMPRPGYPGGSWAYVAQGFRPATDLLRMDLR